MGIHKTAFIHKMACVGEDCSVGARSKVYQFASLQRGATMGEDSHLSPCSILDGSHCGNHTKISAHFMAGPGFKIGHNVFIGPSVTLCNDAWPRVHDRCFDVAEYENAPSIIIGNAASIGANAVILPGVHIGEGAMVAAGSVVTRDVQPWHVWLRIGSQSPISDETRHIGRRMRHAPSFPGENDAIPGQYPKPQAVIS